MELKVAIIGCGKIADGHVEEIQKMPDLARVVAVTDLELLMAEQVATRYRLPAFYDDVDRMLAEAKPDVVHITTPPQSHLAIARKVLAAGAHVYVEKPLTPNLDDTRRLVVAAREAGRKLTIGWSWFLDPELEALAEACRAGALGDLVHVESFFAYSLASPYGKAILADGDHWVHRLPGKLFQNNLDHALCRLPGLLRDDRDDAAVEADPLGDLRVRAEGWVRRPERFGDARDAMCDELRVSFSGGAASAFVWFSSHLKSAGHFTRVYGTKDSAEVQLGMSSLALGSYARLPGALGRLTPAFDRGLKYLRVGARNLGRFVRNDFHYFAGMHRLIRRFYESIEAGGPPPIPPRDLLRVAAWCEEIWRQVPQQPGVRP
jgi:predicted dehydrogenase